MKKSAFRLLVFILIFSLWLPAASTNGQANVDLPPTHPDLPTELAEETALRENTTPNPDMRALTQQQVQSFDCALVTDVSPFECDALVALFESTNGDGWGYTNWLISPTVNDWYGVTVTDGHVTKLNLFENLLIGSIPPELGNLNNLASLNLSLNQLSGSIPPELGNLSNLEYLYLNDNQLSGSIPHELGNLNEITSLDLSLNQLSGSIPPELGTLSNLEYLFLGSNQLSGYIPPELGNLSYLQQLGLSGNQLSGSIPPELGNLSYLEYLYLNENQLSGSIPPELGNLSILYYLDLSFNQLSGSIPSELADVTVLSYLILESNQLSGSIPPQLGNLGNLRSLDLSLNQLSGSIPSQMGNLINLWGLDLSDNKLSGDVPASVTNMVDLCGPGDMEYPCSDESYELNMGFNHLNVPAPEPPASFLNIKDPDWYLTQAVEENIPSQTGGMLVSIDGNTQFDVPMDAVSGTLTLLFAPHSKPSKGTGALSFASNSFELTASVDGTPITNFALPLVLTLHYDEVDLYSIPEDKLNLYYWDTAVSAWVDVINTCESGEYTRNLDENWLSLPICHLSEFALLGDSFDLFLPMITR